MAGSPWTNQVVSQVIIAGSGGELLVYSPTAAAGNLISSIAAQAGTDSFGNHFLAGTASYSSIACNLTGGGISFYTGSLSAGWTLSGQLQSSLLGTIFEVNTFTELELGWAAGPIPQTGTSGFTSVAQVVDALQTIGIFAP